MENAGERRPCRGLTWCALEVGKGPTIVALHSAWVAAAVSFALALDVGTPAIRLASLSTAAQRSARPGARGKQLRSHLPRAVIAPDGPARPQDCGQVERESPATMSRARWVRARAPTASGATMRRRPHRDHSGASPGDSTRCRLRNFDDVRGQSGVIPTAASSSMIRTGSRYPMVARSRRMAGSQVIPHQETTAEGLCTSMVVTPTPQALTVTGFGRVRVARRIISSTKVDKTRRRKSRRAGCQRSRVSIRRSTFFGPTDGDPDLPGIGSTLSIPHAGRARSPRPPREAYTICAESDDGARVWVDGTLVLSIVAGTSTRARRRTCAAARWSGTQGPHTAVRYEYYQSEFGSAGPRLALVDARDDPESRSSLRRHSARQAAHSRPLPPAPLSSASWLSPPGCYPERSTAGVDARPSGHPATIDTTGKVRPDQRGRWPDHGHRVSRAVRRDRRGQRRSQHRLNTDNAPTGSVANFQTAAAGTWTRRQILYPL